MGVIAISTWGTRCEVRQLVCWVPEAALGSLSLSLRLRVSGFWRFFLSCFSFFPEGVRVRVPSFVSVQRLLTIQVFSLIPPVHWPWTRDTGTGTVSLTRQFTTLSIVIRESWRRRTDG